jgi:protein-tyrosine phosphatase
MRIRVHVRKCKQASKHQNAYSNALPLLQSVLRCTVDLPKDCTACHWQVPLDDMDEANLLDHLTQAVKWLEVALRQKGSKVLVHCLAGDSLCVK